MSETLIRDLGAKSHLDALLATVGNVEGLRVIDIGCGGGHMARALAALGADVTGYDPFIEGTEPVASMAPAAFVWSGQVPTPFPNRINRADLVLFIFSLHHVPGAKLAGALAEARRILRPSGRLYVAEPLPQGPHQYVMELFHDETAVRKAPPKLLRISRARASPPIRSRPTRKRGVMPISTRLPSA